METYQMTELIYQFEETAEKIEIGDYLTIGSV